MVKIGDNVRSLILPQLTGRVVRIINKHEFIIKGCKNKEIICHIDFWKVI